MTGSTPDILWKPSARRVAESNISRFIRFANRRAKATIDDGKLTGSSQLYAWSIREPESFWNAVWDFTEVIAQTRGSRTLVDGDKMPGARWYPDARLNYAENLLRRRDAEMAIVFRGEDKIRWRLSYADLYDAVSRTVQALEAAGVGMSAGHEFGDTGGMRFNFACPYARVVKAVERIREAVGAIA